MEKFKGTTEKWIASENLIFADNYFQTHIALIPNSYNDEIREANAKLIASAPEMLEEHENDLKELQLLYDFIFNDQGYSITNPNLLYIEKAIERKEQLISKITE